ncbi:MAG TPA: Calx-beta domain-containing protein [Thermoanaerobaculia bacterium]|nr:Calx-beta domain-containing protein [Thermoanaerobaculia bacterium]
MRKRCLVTGAIFLALAAALAMPAAADEIWIAPSEKGDVAVGDWGLTPAGEAHFSFAVPDSLDRFVGAQVMVIGKQDRHITYDLHLSVSKDGESADAFSADATGLPATLEADELTALDASSLFPALAAGDDVVSLNFQASPKGDLRVVGLRFRFERLPDQAGLACPPGRFLVGFDATGDPVCKTLSEVTGGGGSGGGGPLIGISNVEQPEGNSGSTPFVFEVSLSAPSTGTVTVSFSTRNGTAQAGSDYVAASGSLTFAPGEVTKPVTVQVTGDTTVEDIEVFFVDLSNAAGATIGDTEGLGRIFNDDISEDPGGGGRDD